MNSRYFYLYVHVSPSKLIGRERLRTRVRFNDSRPSPLLVIAFCCNLEQECRATFPAISARSLAQRIGDNDLCNLSERERRNDEDEWRSETARIDLHTRFDSARLSIVIQGRADTGINFYP